LKPQKRSAIKGVARFILKTRYFASSIELMVGSGWRGNNRINRTCELIVEFKFLFTVACDKILLCFGLKG